jgi:hypothetical protein
VWQLSEQLLSKEEEIPKALSVKKKENILLKIKASLATAEVLADIQISYQKTKTFKRI